MLAKPVDGICSGGVSEQSRVDRSTRLPMSRSASERSIFGDGFTGFACRLQGVPSTAQEGSSARLCRWGRDRDQGSTVKLLRGTTETQDAGCQARG